MEKMHKYAIIWGIIVVIIVALLTVFGFIYKNKNADYKKLENKIVEASKKYVDAKFLYPQDKQQLKTTKQELIENGYLDTFEVSGKECDGYVIVKKASGVFQYKGFVNCPQYTSKGYEK